MRDEIYVSPCGTLETWFHWNKKKEAFTSMTITDRSTGEVKSKMEASFPAMEEIIQDHRDRLFVNYYWIDVCGVRREGEVLLQNARRRDEQPV